MQKLAKGANFTSKVITYTLKPSYRHECVPMYYIYVIAIHTYTDIGYVCAVLQHMCVLMLSPSTCVLMCNPPAHVGAEVLSSGMCVC